MGLLGGFKAKLIGRNRRQVSTNVVCTKFNTFRGEFDQSIDNIPSSSNTNLGKNEVVREKRRPKKPEIDTVFSENGPRLNGDVQNSVPKPSPSENSNVKTTPRDVQNGFAKNHDVEATPRDVQDEVADVKATLREIQNDVDVKTTPAPTEYTKTTTTTTTTKSLKHKAPAIPNTPVPTKKPSEERPPVIAVVDDDDDNIPPTLLAARSPLFNLTNDSDSDDDGNFKIHINHNIDNNNSEDEDSLDHDNDDVETPVNYSSQAASIFFGEEVEPEVRRPRNVILNNDDDDDDDNLSEGSSASA